MHRRVSNCSKMSMSSPIPSFCTPQTNAVFRLQGRFTDEFLGLHAAGHFSIGGDAGDIFSSPVDPAFYLHHVCSCPSKILFVQANGLKAMVDRVYWIWQALHQEQANTVAGTITLNNSPPSRNTTLEDLIQTNYLNAEATSIGDMMNTLEGKLLCYIYE